MSDKTDRVVNYRAVVHCGGSLEARLVQCESVAASHGPPIGKLTERVDALDERIDGHVRWKDEHANRLAALEARVNSPQGVQLNPPADGCSIINEAREGSCLPPAVPARERDEVLAKELYSQHTFEWALASLKKVGKVRRTGWHEKSFLALAHSGAAIVAYSARRPSGEEWYPRQRDMLATDWESYTCPRPK